MISGDLKKFIRIVGISKVDSTKIIVFYFVKKTFTPSPYAAILVKEGTKWVTKMQDINLVMSDQTVPISKDYFPTDYFVFDLSTVGNQFAKLLVYPTGKLNFGIPNAEHLSNFSIHDNLSMYIILGKFKINY